MNREIRKLKGDVEAWSNSHNAANTERMRFKNALAMIEDLLPWTSATAEQMRQIAMRALGTPNAPRELPARTTKDDE